MAPTFTWALFTPLTVASGHLFQKEPPERAGSQAGGDSDAEWLFHAHSANAQVGSDFMKLIFNCAHDKIVRCFGASFSLKLGRVIIKIPRYLIE